MKNTESKAFTVSLWPLPAFIVFLLWPCLGVSVVLGEIAYTVALVVSDVNDLGRQERFTLLDPPQP